MSWLLFDLHGSVAAVCGAGSTTLSDAYRYDGFGQQIANTGSVTNPWRYRGLLNLTSDFGAGALLDMNARDYSPQLGVFTQEDSVQGSAANPFTMNRFLYALANPATLIDPDGHRACLDEGSVCTTSPKLDEQVGTRLVTSSTRRRSACDNVCVGPGTPITVVDNYWLLGPDGALVDLDQYEELAGCGIARELEHPPICDAWLKTFENIGQLDSEDEYEWASPILTGLIGEWLEDMLKQHGTDLSKAGAFNVIVGWGVGGEGPGGQFQLGISQRELGKYLRIGGHAVFVASVTADFLDSYNERFNKDISHALDPMTRVARAGIQGGLSASLGAAGSVSGGLLAYKACGRPTWYCVLAGLGGAAATGYVGSKVGDELANRILWLPGDPE